MQNIRLKNYNHRNLQIIENCLYFNDKSEKKSKIKDTQTILKLNIENP